MLVQGIRLGPDVQFDGSTARQLVLEYWDPGPTASTHWQPAATTSPQACDGSWSHSCAYDDGWNAAQDSFNKATTASSLTAATSAPWWLDVETADNWSSTDLATNRSD